MKLLSGVAVDRPVDPDGYSSRTNSVAACLVALTACSDDDGVSHSTT